MNARIIEIKGKDIRLAYHPAGGEPRVGDALVLHERHPSRSGSGVVVQVIAHDSAGYPGDREADLQELLEEAVALRHDIVRGEPGLVDLKEIKVARCKVRKRLSDGQWLEWDGSIPSRNVVVEPVGSDALLSHVLPADPISPITIAAYDGMPVTLEAERLDKVNALVGVKGSGKSHTGKLLVSSLAGLGAPCWVFDINREFIDLPGADVVRVGDNFQFSLAEVGFPFLMAVVDDLGPLQDISRGAFEYTGHKLMEQEIRKTGYATIEYLLDRAENSGFHSHETVNQAIATRLRMVQNSGLFSEDPDAETLQERFDRVTDAGGFLVFDLAELRIGRLKAVVRGLNRQLERICSTERETGRARYPFVFYEEAHFYAPENEIVNLITRGRHLGLTTFFITNTPTSLPETVFRQVDNLVVTGLSHSADLRTIAKCSLSDEDTLESLAMSLGPTQALMVGRATRGFPMVVEINALPAGFPSTGTTRSFWRDAAKSRRGPASRPKGKGAAHRRRAAR